MKQLFFYATIVSAVFIFSCSKRVDRPPTPQQVDSIKIFGLDSSELVKSITSVWTDSTGDNGDSNTIYLYYDTVNKKIFFAPTPVSGPNPANYEAVLSYNSSYQLSNYKANPALLQDTGQAANIDYIYDNENIISSETTTCASGSKEVENINKTGLPSGGYSLSTKDADYPGDTSLNVSNFNTNGLLISWSVTLLPATNPWLIDSLVYDAAGNINVIENDSFFTSPVNLFQMSSRAIHGNELCVLNKILYNGISQLPEESIGGSGLGRLLNGFDNFFFYQFTQYPASSVTVYQEYSSSYVTFNTNVQFDSKNRLTSLKMYNGDVGNAYYETVKLGYYK